MPANPANPAIPAIPAISRELAAHAVRTRFGDLPPGAIAAVKRCVLDALGVALAGGALGQAVPAFLDLARVSGAGPCRIIGFELAAAPAVAALVNGAMSHALDFEDTHDGGLVHPNGTALPAALAIAQLRGDVSGPEFIAALALGADITCRLGLSMGNVDTPRGWAIRPLLGTYGATAAAGRLLGLDEHQLVDAFALAFSQATSSAGFFGYAPSHMREVRDAFGAQAAVTAALLARGGVRCHDQPIEGPQGLFALYAGGDYDPDRLLAGLGRVFEGEHLSFKPWPSCRGTHPFVEAALELRARHAIRPEDIERIDAEVSDLFGVLCEPFAQKCRPQTANDAKFSLPFTTATALVHGRLGLADFEPHALADEAVAALAQRIRCTVRPPAPLEDALRGALAIHLRDGRVIEHRVQRPLGDPQRPLDDAALLVKFVDCARQAARPLDEGAARAAAEAIARLDEAADLSALQL
jgi:2-methylcitrate dehydratase PrpD